MSDTIIERTKKLDWPKLLGAFVIGILAFIAFRVMTFKGNAVHYHANFALYVNGERDTFDNFSFYEEVQVCGGDEDNPKNRVHMHGKVNSIAHVHANGATWGHFLANLGYTLGNTVLKTDKGVYVNGQNGELTFTLNGESVDTIANRAIESEDRLLISFGNEDNATLKKRYDEIPANAGEYNQKQDPSSCAGGESVTLTSKLKDILGIKPASH